MSEVNECRSPITKEELSYAWDRRRLEWLECNRLFYDWISNMEEIVKAVKNEPNLDNLRHVLISLMAKLQEFKSWRVGMRACTCALHDSF